MSVVDGISEAMSSQIAPKASCPALKSSLASSTSSSDSKDAPSELSLTQAINAASKPYHTELNRSIMARLALTLPPQTNDPSVYAIGVRHLLPIYHAFETAWSKYVSVEPKTPTMEDFSMEEAVVLSVLIHLNLPQLARTDRLREDVATLLGVGHGELDSWMMKAAREDDLVPAEFGEDEESRLEPPSGMVEDEGGESVVEEEDPEALDRSSIPEADKDEYPALHTFLRHIQEITEEKPHVLVAYGWVLYMALFNGGRWIRAQLSKARVNWDLTLVSATQDPTALADKDETGLSFWHFDGAHDGEDVKDEFKARMRDIEPMLSDEQRNDIIQEAVIIFRSISRLVEELDDMNSHVDEGAELDDAETVAVEEEEEEPTMIRSYMMRPRWETPLSYLQLLFQVLLPVGLWEMLMLLVRLIQGTPVHFPILRWSADESPAFGQDG